MIGYIHKAGWFVGLMLLQVLILNNVNIGGYATPFVYIYFILKLDSDTSRNALLMWGFFLGLAIDIFSNTPGINAAATVFLAFARPPFLRAFTSRDVQDNMEPGINGMGFVSFFKYCFILALGHHAVLFALSFYSFANIPILLLKILTSTLLTVVCVIAIDKTRK